MLFPKGNALRATLDLAFATRTRVSKRIVGETTLSTIGALHMVGAVIKELISCTRQALTSANIASQTRVKARALPLSAVVPEARLTLVVISIGIC